MSIYFCFVVCELSGTNLHTNFLGEVATLLDIFSTKEIFSIFCRMKPRLNATPIVKSVVFVIWSKYYLKTVIACNSPSYLFAVKSI